LVSARVAAPVFAAGGVVIAAIEPGSIETEPMKAPHETRRQNRSIQRS
jgi:hypothetical protein